MILMLMWALSIEITSHTLRIKYFGSETFGIRRFLGWNIMINLCKWHLMILIAHTLLDNKNR